MDLRRSIVPACFLAASAFLPAFGAGADAAPFIVTVDSSFASSPASIDYKGSTFTFTSTGDIFNPTAVQTLGGGAVRSFGGFFIFPLQPSTDFPDRGSGILTYGPDTQFASYAAPATIPYSNGDNYLGLRATLNGLDYYGYAYTADTTLKSFGFETTANTAFTLNTSTTPASVPEPATWAMMLVGFGVMGGALRRTRRPAVRFG